MIRIHRPCARKPPFSHLPIPSSFTPTSSDSLVIHSDIFRRRTHTFRHRPELPNVASVASVAHRLFRSSSDSFPLFSDLIPSPDFTSYCPVTCTMIRATRSSRLLTFIYFCNIYFIWLPLSFHISFLMLSDQVSYDFYISYHPLSPRIFSLYSPTFLGIKILVNYQRK